MTSETKQNLFKITSTAAACAFAAAGKSLIADDGFWTLASGLAVNVASQFGVEVCMPYITKKWLSHPDRVVNQHIQRSLVAAVHTALAEIEQEYFGRDGISPREEKSLRDFFTVLRGRSEQEFLEVTRDELNKQEVLDYVYDPTQSAKHLQDRLRIKLDPLSDEYYFTDQFRTYFPERFTALVQSHFRELLKQGNGAKEALDLLFFETLNAGLKELKLGQEQIRQLLDEASHGNQVKERIDFYGEIWISAIRKNRDQLSRIEDSTKILIEELSKIKFDVSDIKSSIQIIFNSPVKPGLELSKQFQQLKNSAMNTDSDFLKAKISLEELEAVIHENPKLANSLKNNLERSKKEIFDTKRRQQKANSELAKFLKDIELTQEAILKSTSNRASEARELFEQGLFLEANKALDNRTLLEDKLKIINLRQNLDKQIVIVNERFEELSNDFILKAQLLI